MPLQDDLLVYGCELRQTGTIRADFLHAHRCFESCDGALLEV